jgi:hypothetical protein
MLMTESVDNFISATRNDFLDARYRSVSLADLFPDGYRRWLGNNLTGDDFIKGVRIPSQQNERPVTDEAGFVAGLGYTTWWHPAGPQACFPGRNSTVCSVFGQGAGQAAAPANPLGDAPPPYTVVVDPQVGFEQQKFMIANTLMYLPENQKLAWLDQLRIWELGADSDPGFTERLAFYHPSGRVYVAKTGGTEVIYGKTVQKNIGARVIEYANELLQRAYETTPVTVNNVVVGYQVKRNANGDPIVLFDNLTKINPATGALGDNPTCSADDHSGCTCQDNSACVQLESYVSVPQFMREAIATFGFADPSMKGIYTAK